jgi:PPK2 family polyphosphate:nucleotide phosphotransferase
MPAGPEAHRLEEETMSLQPVPPGSRLALDDDDARAPKDLPGSEELRADLGRFSERLEALQRAFYAECKRSLLIVIQGRDTSGKDGLIRKVFGPLDSQGCVVTAFKKPSELELSHDYLWRVHHAVPPRSVIGIFNRSHYEDVLIVRVRKLVSEAVWSRRYSHINDFERMLTDSGVTILKLFLHISKKEQKERLEERLKDPAKNWKFNPGDLDERALWDDYTEAYREMLARCSTEWAPWYVVPSDKKAARDFLVADVVVRTLERLDPQFPRANPDVLKLVKEIV